MRKILLTLSAIIFLSILPSMKAEAAVKTMPDGGLFDPSFYAATYKDVYQAFGMNEALLYQHYLLCGIKEKRLPYAGYIYPTPDELKKKLMAKLELGDSTVQEIIRMCLKSELRMVDGKVCLSPSESQNEPTA